MSFTKSTTLRQCQNVCVEQQDAELRRWLYMSTLRWIQKSPVKEWYQRKKLQTGNKLPGDNDKRSGGKALIAVLRKLLKGFFHSMIHDVAFDARKLFFKESSKKQDRTPGLRGKPKRKQSYQRKNQDMQDVPKNLEEVF